MSVLSELVDDAASDGIPTAVLLRRIKVLAVRLKTPPLAQWVQNELDGYEPDDVLPDYRGPFDSEPLGMFSGPFGSSMTNVGMPKIGIDADSRDTFEPFYTFSIRQGLPSIEQFLAGSANGMQFNWPADAVAYVNTLINSGKIHWYEMHGLVAAHNPISRTILSDIVATVRNRVLDLALGIEAEDPSAGDPAKATIAPEQVATIYNTVVHGGNVAVGASDFTQIINTRPTSLNDLLSRLESVGVPADLRADLAAAIEADGEPSGAPGEEVTGWLGRAAAWAGTQASNAGSGALGGVITQVVLMYLGLA